MHQELLLPASGRIDQPLTTITTTYIYTTDHYIYISYADFQRPLTMFCEIKYMKLHLIKGYPVNIQAFLNGFKCRVQQCRFIPDMFIIRNRLEQ